MPPEILSQLSAIEAKLEALQRDVARIEPAQQRNYDNVDMTRHATANNIQKVLGELDIIKTDLRSLTKDIRPVIDMADEVRNAKHGVSGGIKVAQWVWPLICILFAAAYGYEQLK